MTNVPAGMEVALFAMGCFWGVERLFRHCRGFTAPPQVSTAAAIRPIRLIAKAHAAARAGHAEAVRVVYDPQVD